MKRIILFIFILSLLFACKRPQSVRHVVRAVQDVSEMKKTSDTPKATGTSIGPQLLDYSINEDSLGKAIYIANYLTPDSKNIDTYIKVLTPQQLKFDKSQHSQWNVDFYYFSDSAKTNLITKRKYIFIDSAAYGLEFIGKPVENF